MTPKKFREREKIIIAAVRDYFMADDVNTQRKRIHKAILLHDYKSLDAVDLSIVKIIQKNLKDEEYVKTLRKENE